MRQRSAVPLLLLLRSSGAIGGCKSDKLLPFLMVCVRARAPYAVTEVTSRIHFSNDWILNSFFFFFLNFATPRGCYLFRIDIEVKKCFRRDLVCLGLERKPLCVCVCVNT